MTLTAVRTETECVADAIYHLWVARILPEGLLHAAAVKLGITKENLAGAKMRHVNGRYRVPEPRPLLPTVAAVPDSRPTASAPNPGEKGYRPDDLLELATGSGTKFCRRCELHKATADFPATSRVCRDCINREKRRRYLSVEQQESVYSARLRYEVSRCDPELRCETCNRTLREGEIVTAHSVKLVHDRCPRCVAR